jgi:hypothetical protein
METLTHWKKVRNPDYLGSYAMPPDGSEIILTISKAQKESVAGTDGKKEDCLVIHFAEPGWKPMILNSTNAKVIQRLAGTPYIERWGGTRVQIYTAKVKAFGDVHDALRIRTFVSESKTADQVPVNGEQIIDACLLIESAETLDELKAVYTKLDKVVGLHPEVVAAKDKRKYELTGGRQNANT